MGDGIFYLVEWPYHNCKVFSHKDQVIYHLIGEELTFYHPGKANWQPASRKQILREARILNTANTLEDLNVSL